MNKYLLPLLILLQFSCKKKETINVPDAVDALTGTYTGNVFTATEDFTYNGSPHYIYDTIDNGSHIATVTKITSDSFRVTCASMPGMSTTTWQYKANNEYLRGASQSGLSTSDKVTFVAGTDSLYLVSTNSVFDEGGSFGHFTTRIYFSGKKQ